MWPLKEQKSEINTPEETSETTHQSPWTQSSIHDLLLWMQPWTVVTQEILRQLDWRYVIVETIESSGPFTSFHIVESDAEWVFRLTTNGCIPSWVSWEKTEIINYMRELWYTATRHWRSHFETRQWYTFDKDIETSAEKYHVFDAHTQSWEILTTWEYRTSAVNIQLIQQVNKDLAWAATTIESRNRKNTLDVLEANMQWVTTTITVWWHSEHVRSHIPDYYDILVDIRVANTRDHRLKLSHTSDLLLLDTRSLPSSGRISLIVPDKYKWIVIWKKWANIQALGKRYGLFFNVK